MATWPAWNVYRNLAIFICILLSEKRKFCGRLISDSTRTMEQYEKSLGKKVYLFLLMRHQACLEVFYSFFFSLCVSPPLDFFMLNCLSPGFVSLKMAYRTTKDSPTIHRKFAICLVAMDQNSILFIRSNLFPRCTTLDWRKPVFNIPSFPSQYAIVFHSYTRSKQDIYAQCWLTCLLM